MHSFAKLKNKRGSIKKYSLGIFYVIFILLSLSVNAGRERNNSSSNLHVSASTSPPPNIVVILVDDAGYDDFGFQNSNTISTTPQLDVLANEGTIFTQAYVTNGLCAPSRAGMLSGRYNSDVGFQYNIASGISANSAAPGHTLTDIGLDPTVPTMGNYLQDLGYETALFGKWHLGYGGQTQHLPNNRGFDFFYGLLGGSRPYDAQTTDDHKKIRRNNVLEEPTNNNFFLTDLLTDEALTYMTQQINQNAPFLAFMSYTAPHGPYTAKPADYTYFDSLNTAQNLGLSENNKNYYGLLKNVDDNVKRIVDLLKLNNEYDNTLFVFLSDNGGVVSKAGSNGALSGEKGSTLEGGLRVPFFMTWKNAVPSAGVYNEQVISLDLTTTFIEAAGGNLSANTYFDLEGKDLVSAVNNSTSVIHPTLYWRKGIGGGAVSDGTNKVRFTQLDSFQTSAPQLYNLDADLGETTNIYASNTSTAQPLIDDWYTWRGTLDLPSYIPGGVVESVCGLGVPINSCNFLTNYYSNFASYTHLTQVSNTPLSVSQTTETLLRANLEYKDSIKSEGEITYVLTQLPVYGSIQKSGQTLTIGDEFKQIDINTGDISYVYNGTMASADLVKFNVNDGSGGETINNVSYAFALPSNYSDTFDSDGDGIVDADDLDDDNDGILDRDEYKFTQQINVKPDDMGLSVPSIGNNGTAVDISAKLGLPSGTVTVSFTNADATTTSGGSAIFNKDTTASLARFTISSTYPLLFRPGLGNSFNAVGDTRGFTSLDGKTYKLSSNLYTGFTHVVNGNAYTVERGATSIDGLSCLEDNLIWMSDNVTTSFDISYNASGSGSNYRLTFKIPADTDGDGNPDYLDLDSDGDGIADIVEAGGTDANGDGEVDYPIAGDPSSMVDANNNGWSSFFDDGSADSSSSENGTPLADSDSDNDTYENRIDIDSDGDGIVDNIEGQTTLGYIAPSGTDTDSDGLDDAYDIDNSGTAVVPTNTDNTDNPDYIDEDSDNDSRTDAVEGYDTNTPTDGIANITPAIADLDLDGLDDNYDLFDKSNPPGSGINSANGIQTPTDFPDTDIPGGEPNWREFNFTANPDTDADGITNTTDKDDDNDGILDVDEYNLGGTINVKPSDCGLALPTSVSDPAIIYSGSADISAKLGLPPGSVTMSFTNVGVRRTSTTNNDGLFNVGAGAAPAQFALTSKYPLLSRPGSGRSFNNTLDTRGFTSNDGKAYGLLNPQNIKSGFTNSVVGNVYTVEATTGSGNSTSSNNLIWQSDEVSTSFDVSFFATGSPANIRTTFRVPGDTDKDGIPDFLDKDSDGDGIPDIVEAGGVDLDNDGEVDYPTSYDPISMEDDNSNGWSDIHDNDVTLSTPGTPLADPDSEATPDGYKDRVDIDSDNDGIADNIEAQTTAGYKAPADIDSDQDGIDDAYDRDCTPCGLITGSPITPTNTDGADGPDYLDTDSDNDGRTDAVEGYDTDVPTDGVADTAPAGVDGDMDGLDNNFDEFDLTSPSGLLGSNGANGTQTPLSFPDTDIPGGEPNWREPQGIPVFVKVFLEGTYNAAKNNMDNVLGTGGATSILAVNALAQPYNVVPWNYAGTETVDANFFVTNTDVVDWVLIELRDKTDSTTIVARRAGLVIQDGDVIDIDGVTGLSFEGLVSDDYYISVRHRNHLGVMSAGLVTLDATATGNEIDFTTTTTALFGDGTAAVEIESGVNALHMGNANHTDNVVKFTGSNNDKAFIGIRVNSTVNLTNTVQGYNFEDIDLDGVTSFTGSGNDKAKKGNKLKTTVNLLNCFIEQLP